jgi:CRP-like cAMP-binding protein
MDATSLRTLPGFGRMGSRELGLLERYSSEAAVRKGRALYYQGDEGAAAYLVLSGRVRPIRVGGSPAALEDAVRGSWLGLPETLLGLAYATDALAVEAATLRRVGRFNLLELLREEAMKDLVIGALASENYLLYGKLDAAGAIERVARAVAARAPASKDGAGPEPGATIRIACTQAELAESAGLTRETVNRCLRRLEEAGLVETERGGLLIYDLEGLRSYSESG